MVELNCVGVASQTPLLRANAAAAAEVQRWTLMTPMVMQNLTSLLDTRISFYLWEQVTILSILAIHATEPLQVMLVMLAVMILSWK